MSVKYQNKTRLNSSVRDTRERTPNPHEETYQLCCSPNSIQFHKKLIQSLSLHLICVCTLPQQQGSRQSEYWLQVSGLNLLVVNCQVKHTFSLEEHLRESTSYLRIRLPPQHTITVQTCSISHRAAPRISMVPDQAKFNPESNVSIVDPMKLIQQSIKLRALRLSRSSQKVLNYNSLATMNMPTSRKEPALSPCQDSPAFNWKPRTQARRASVCYTTSFHTTENLQRSRQNSMSKLAESKPKLTGKELANSLLRNIGKSRRSRQCSDPNSKLKSSASHQNVCLPSSARKELKLRNTEKEQDQEQVQSQVYYTSHKKGRKCEQSWGHQERRHTKTQTKENLESQPQRKGELGGIKQTKLALNSSVVANKFVKNISQNKIAQVSKILDPRAKK